MEIAIDNRHVPQYEGLLDTAENQSARLRTMTLSSVVVN
jgi:hypothetical protein